LAVLKVSLEIFNGDLKGYSQVPDEKEVRERFLKSFMQDLIKTSVQNAIFKLQKRDEAKQLMPGG
jgi:hypothetical protein